MVVTQRKKTQNAYPCLPARGNVSVIGIFLPMLGRKIIGSMGKLFPCVFRRPISLTVWLALFGIAVRRNRKRRTVRTSAFSASQLEEVSREAAGVVRSGVCFDREPWRAEATMAMDGQVPRAPWMAQERLETREGRRAVAPRDPRRGTGDLLLCGIQAGLAQGVPLAIHRTGSR